MRIETQSRMEEDRSGDLMMIHYTTDAGRVVRVSFDDLGVRS